MATTRVYISGAFGLEIDAVPCGFVTSVEGGFIHGDVVSEPPGTDGVVRKHIAGIGYDEIIVSCGVVAGPLMSWVTEFLTGSAPRHDGAIVLLDFDYNQTSRLDWRRATLSSVAFPALDGASRDPARLTVTIRPESTRVTPASGRSAQLPTTGKQPKSWLASNFRVDIPGVDCSKVTSVAALAVAQGGVGDDAGAVRDPGRRATPLEVSDLVLSIREPGGAGFEAWRDDFLVNGNNDATQEKTATITALATNLKDELFHLQVQGVGIHHLATSKRATSTEVVMRQTASMYCEQVALVLPKEDVPEPPVPVPSAAADAPATGPSAAQAEPVEVARRLLATRDSEQASTGVDLRFEQGARLGTRWAQQLAGLDELIELAAVSRTEWSAISLPEGHSLVESLTKAGVLPNGHEGGLDLVRDSFVSGLVSGVADTYAQVKAHLEPPAPPP
ncbi:MAG: hypothetical protein ABIQ13_00285 [Pedococcus sp.]